VAMVMQYFRREDSQISVGVHQSALHRYDDESRTSDCFRLALGGSSETLRRLVIVAMVMRYFRREDSQISIGVHQSALHRYDDEFGA
jgi:hypothetical protein